MAKVKSLGRAFKKSLGREDEIVSEVWRTRERVTLFMNDTRREVFQYLCKHPCDSLSGISRALHMTPPTAKWHLDKLVAHNFISMKRVRGKTVFYPTNMIDDADVDLLAMFNDHQIKHVFTAIRNNPGITQKALSNLLATSHQTIILHTGRLEDAGFITSIKDGKYNRYYLTDKITKKNDSYYKRIREFREHVLKTFKQDGIKPELVRSTEKGIIIRITAGEAQAVLELSTYPFTTVFF